MVSVPSAGDRVSRWTPAIFACAFVNFALAQLLIVTGASWPAAQEADGVTLAVVHRVTVGWITLVVFGALFQFVPALTGAALGDQHLSLATLGLVEHRRPWRQEMMQPSYRQLPAINRPFIADCPGRGRRGRERAQDRSAGVVGTAQQ